MKTILSLIVSLFSFLFSFAQQDTIKIDCRWDKNVITNFCDMHMEITNIKILKEGNSNKLSFDYKVQASKVDSLFLEATPFSQNTLPSDIQLSLMSVFFYLPPVSQGKLNLKIASDDRCIELLISSYSKNAYVPNILKVNFGLGKNDEVQGFSQVILKGY